MRLNEIIEPKNNIQEILNVLKTNYSDYGPVMIRNPEKNQITESQKLSPNPQLWQQALAPLTKTLYKEWRSHKWTWTTGGCFAFAEAFRKAYGGVLYGVCRIDVQDGETEYPADHALVKLNGAFWDYNGIFDVSKIKKNQVIKRKGEDYVGWFEDDFLDDEQMSFLMKTMKKCAIGNIVLESTQNNFSIKDVTIEQNGPMFKAMYQNKCIGLLLIDMHRSHEDNYSVSRSQVAFKYQRKGVGSLLYDAAENWLSDMGAKLIPSPPSELSPEAHAFWKKRDPYGDIRFDQRKPIREVKKLPNNIQEILNVLKTNSKIIPFHDRMKIFGSVAQDKENPGDVDIMLDYSDFQGSLYHPSEIPGIGIFLSLAKKYYGYVDVFVKVGRLLYCRNELATDWTEASHARKIWSDSKKFGKNLDKIGLNESKKIQSIPKYVYHGTTLFEWNSQKDGQCFFTSSKEEAVRYAEEANIAEYERKHTDREGVLKGYYGNEEEPIIDESIVSIIVKFSLADLLNLQNNGAKFEPDWGWDGCTSQTTWQTSLKTVGSFCIENFKHEFKKLGKIIKV